MKKSLPCFFSSSMKARKVKIQRFQHFTSAMLFGWCVSAGAAEDKLNFEEHIEPIFRNQCARCHNADESKGGLDLSNFGALLRGGASGVVLNSEDPEGSKLFRVIAHTEEPTMPPNKKLSDQELSTVAKWITGGLLETSKSKAIKSNKPKMDLSLKGAPIGKPEGPPALPQDLVLEPVVRTPRTTAILGMAGSPWAPVAAVAGQRQVLLYRTDKMELAGVLEFPEGHPREVGFTRNGKLVFASGGRGASIGLVALWDVITGERILTVGKEFDSVLAADISPDQQWVALGGPDRLIKVFSTADGEKRFQMKKHTDWVTAVAFSPDGRYLATGDRVGGVFVWEAGSDQILYTLNGHKGWISGLSWRSDSALLLSASEDGTIKTWKVEEETAVRSWTAHGGGTLDAQYAQNGNVLSCGRDGNIKVWDGSGKQLRAIKAPKDMPVRVAFDFEAKKVLAGDFSGNVFLWNAEDGKLLTELSANPPTVDSRLAAALAELKKHESEAGAKAAAQAAAMKQLAGIKAAMDKARAESNVLQFEESLTKAAAVNLELAKKAETDVKDLKALVDASTKALENARKQAEALKAKLGGNDPAYQQYLSLQKQSEEVAKKLETAKSAYSVAKADLDRVLVDVRKWRAAEYNLKLHQAREERNRMESESLLAKAELTDAEASASNAQALVQRLHKRRASFPDHLEGMQNVLKLDQRFAQEAAHAVVAKEKEIGDLNARIASLTQEWEKAKQALSGVKSSKESMVALQKLDGQKKALADLEVSLAKAGKDLEKANKNLVSQQSKRAALKEGSEGYEAAKAALEEVIQKQEGQVANLKKGLQEQEKALVASRESIQKLESEVQRLAKSFETEKKAAAEKVTGIEKQLTAVKASVPGHQKQLTALREASKLQDAEVLKTQSALAALKELEKQLPGQIAEAEKASQAAEAARVAAAQASQTAEKALAGAEAKVQQMTAEYEKIKSGQTPVQQAASR